MRRLRYSDSSQKLIEKLASEGSEQSFVLAKALLEIMPDPDVDAKGKKEGEIFRPSLEPQSRLDDWQYTQFLENIYPKLLALNVNKALELVCDPLQDFASFSYPEHVTNGTYDDISQVWRPAIEDHSQNHRHSDIENSLVDVVRDTAIKIVKDSPDSLPTLVKMLEDRRWLVFRRVALFVLSVYPELQLDMVAERLTNEELFIDGSFRHEYALLAGKVFGLLPPEKQAIIFGWIEKAEPIKAAIERDRKNGEVSPDREKILIDVWQRDKLSLISQHLTGSWKELYEKLLSQYGEPEHPDFSSYSTSWSGPTSVKNAKELIESGAEKMLSFLKAWEPKKSRFDFGPSREGLGREIAEAVKLDPCFFEPLAEQFKELDPTYVRSYLDGFFNLAQNNVNFAWDNVLSLSEWVVSQNREIPDRTGGVMDQDPDWGWARRTVGSLISRGLNSNAISLESRERVWKIIERLTDDPHPTSEEEKSREDDRSDDAYSHSINTVRGVGIGAVVEYALWLYRIIEKTDGKEKLKEGFELMPEVRAMLEKHLDPKVGSSVATRAVYGRFLPWLLLIDKVWVQKNATAIFPPGEFERPYYRAAWEGYILYCNPYDDVLAVFRNQYKEAVDNIGKLKKNRRADQDEVLSQHIVSFYWRGKLTLKDDLIQKFWELANPDLRQHALDFIGRSLISDEVALPQDVLLRLKELWDSRMQLASASVDQKTYADEMAAFSLWFASGKFDEKWSAEQYLRALAIGNPRTRSDHYIAKRLLQTVKNFPVEAIGILEKLVLTGGHSWIIFGNKDEVTSVIQSALSSGNKQAEKAAKDLVGRLVANGHLEFRDLLTVKENITP